jgi:hypothetical protein
MQAGRGSPVNNHIERSDTDFLPIEFAPKSAGFGAGFFFVPFFRKTV